MMRASQTNANTHEDRNAGTEGTPMGSTGRSSLSPNTSRALCKKAAICILGCRGGSRRTSADGEFPSF
jgi:hypothetical protein